MNTTYQARCGRSLGDRRAFTLVELLASMLILAILAAISMNTLANIEGNARIERTKTLIARIDILIMERYSDYLTRTVPIRPMAGTAPKQVAQQRLLALRELIRMEMPERQGDLDYGVSSTIRVKYLNAPPALARSYRVKVEALKASSGLEWTQAYEGPECLYLILSMMRIGDKTALDSLPSREFGNVDEDAIPEIHDAWGTPIGFLRWAPGYINNPVAAAYTVLTPQNRNADTYPDPFDPLRLDPRWAGSGPFKPFSLKPLIYSWGPDKENGITEYDYEISDPTGQLQLYQYDHDSDPYLLLPKCSRYVGQPFDSGRSFPDNITNHYLGARQ